MITPGQNFTGKVGVPFTATPTTPGTVALWRAERLPDGLSLNSSTGAITGTPEKVGNFTTIFSDKSFAKGVLNGGSYGSKGFRYHAIKNDGTLVGWGSDATGSIVPSGLSDVVEISRDLALKKDGTVVAIGYGVAPSGLSNVAALGTNLVLKKDGTLFAWGDNTYGQTNVPAGSDFVAVASGLRWHVALRSNGTVVGWGQSNSGLLNTTDIAGVTAIAAGSNFYLTLHEDGTVFSRAGSNNLDDIWSYGADANLPKAIAIAAGNNRSLVLLEDGRVYRYGDAGYPSTSGIVQNLSGVVAIGVYDSFSAVKNDGSVVRWGETLTQNTPVEVANIKASTVTLGGSTAAFTISEGAPLITPAQTLTGVVADGVNPTLFNRTPALTNAENRPAASWSATGLPSWASINALTGAITGAPPDFGTSTITVTATGPGGSSSESVELDINLGRPSLPAGQVFTGTIGVYQSAQYPLAEDLQRRPISSWAVSGTFPFGLQINSATGEISGTPETFGNGFNSSINPSSAGTYQFTISATGLGGTTSVEATFKLLPRPGRIVLLSNTGSIGVLFSQNPRLENNTSPAESWRASGLPAWATINSSTGTISGYPTEDGTTSISITAALADGGEITSDVEISISSLPVGTIVKGKNYFRVGNWSPSDLYSLNGGTNPGFFWTTSPQEPGDTGTIPTGMAIVPLDNPHANITGTPTVFGRFKGVASFSGLGSSNFNVLVIGQPVITAGQSFSGVIGESLLVQAQALDTVNQPITRWSATGLPTWASISANGTLSGTPAANGNFQITLIAMGPAGTTTTPATIIVATGPPRITTGQIFPGRQGAVFSESIPSLDNVVNRPVTLWSAAGLPAGLSINPVTGAITGIPTGYGAITASITATGPGGSDTELVLFQIAATPPIFAGPIRAMSVYAGASKGKAIYYGSKLLWNVAGWVPSVFSPKSIPGLRLWLDASVGVYDASTGGNIVTTAVPVLRWEDQSGNGFHATAVSATAPSLAISQINGRPALAFNGGKYFSITNPLNGAGVTVFVVVNPSSLNSDSGPLIGNIGSANSSSHYPFRGGSIYDKFASSTRRTVTKPTDFYSWHIYTVISAPNDWRYFFNGLQKYSTGDNIYSGATYSTSASIGLDLAGGTYTFLGSVCEVVIYNSVLSSEQLAQVAEYLRSKYALF